MKTYFPVSWSKLSIIITAAVAILIIVLGVVYLAEGNWTDKTRFAVLAAVIVALLCIVALVPKRIEITQHSLRICRLAGTKEIPLQEIAETGLSFVPTSLKLCGSGGFCGNIGWYKSDSFGIYFSYATNQAEAFYVILKNGKRYMLSCKNPDAAIEAIKAKA